MYPFQTKQNGTSGDWFRGVSLFIPQITSADKFQEHVNHQFWSEFLCLICKQFRLATFFVQHCNKIHVHVTIKTIQRN